MAIKATVFNTTDFDEMPIHTSSLYATPDENHVTYSQLHESLLALTRHETPDTFFAIAVMSTFSEITIAPLGVLKPAEVRNFGSNASINWDQLSPDQVMEWPLAVQFEPHSADGQLTVDTTLDTAALFNDFEPTFKALWAIVENNLKINDELMLAAISALVTEARKTKTTYSNQLLKMDLQARKEKVGFDLPDDRLEEFVQFMGDAQGAAAIEEAAAQFVQHELIGDQTLAAMMADQVRQTTFFWVLDNTFYQIYYYFVLAYTEDAVSDKLTKHLYHMQKQQIQQMRQTAMENAEKLIESPQDNLKPNMIKFFDQLFTPISEAFATRILAFEK